MKNTEDEHRDNCCSAECILFKINWDTVHHFLSSIQESMWWADNQFLNSLLSFLLSLFLCGTAEVALSAAEHYFHRHSFFIPKPSSIFLSLFFQFFFLARNSSSKYVVKLRYETSVYVFFLLALKSLWIVSCHYWRSLEFVIDDDAALPSLNATYI